MTISSTTRKAGPFIGNGTTTAFPFAYKVFQASDLLVVRLDTTLNIEHELTLNTDYTVTLNLDQDSNPGGTVNLLAALATGYTLTLTSDLPNLQPTDLTNQGGFYPDVINDALDRATIQIQQLQEQTDRSLKVAVSSTADATLPPPSPNDLIGWDATGEALINVDPGTIATVVAYATAYADTFYGDGVTTDWTLTRNPAVLYNLDVSISGVTQTPGLDYTLAGTTFTTTTPAPAGALILVKYKEGLPNYEGDSQDVRFVQAGAGAATRSVQSKLRDIVSALDFMTAAQISDVISNTGSIDVTAAVQAAIDSLPANGGTVYFPIGTYLISTLNMPNDPKVVNLVGANMKGVILKMATAAGPIIQKANSAGRVTGGYFSDFTVKANASSDKTNLLHRALNFTGWTNSHFKRLRYLSNGTGSVGVFFYMNAKDWLTYANTVEGIEIIGQLGPSRGVFLTNGGTYLAGPNVFEIRDSTFYANTGMNCAVDCYDCTKINIINNLFEDCPGCTAVGMGQATLVQGNWFELMTGGNIVTNAAASIDGSSSLVIGNYMSDQTSFIDTINQRPLWIQNVGPGSGNITGQGACVVEAPYGASPAIPTITPVVGTATLLAHSVRIPRDASGRITYTMWYSYTPTGAGNVKWTMSATPTGYEIESMQAACFRGANGEPKPCGVSLVASPAEIWVNYTTTDGHDIQVTVTMKKTGVFA